MSRRWLQAALLAVALSGCRLARYELTEPLDGRVIEVKSGDRVSVVLEEDAAAGYLWQPECADGDISFVRDEIASSDTDVLRGAPCKVRIIMRVHRGFDGPAHIRLLYVRPWEPHKPARTIEMLFYKKAEDVAPWK